jgi:hypothetical protein
MTDIDISAAASFMATHARLLDRRRFEVVTGGTDHSAVLAAVEAYRNPDGGYGWGLEPDLRCPESQPGGALHAFEALADIAPTTTPHAVALCDWLAKVSLPDGGLPFALPMADRTGSAPFWTEADPTVASLQSTAFVTAVALRVARFDPAVAAHPWLGRAKQYCFDAIAALTEAPHAIALSFAVHVLDATGNADLMDHVRQFVPASGVLPVAGGAADEALRPLDLAPGPGLARSLFSEEIIDADLARLAALQQPDGGWVVDFGSFSPMAALEWRGHATVRAVSILLAG